MNWKKTKLLLVPLLVLCFTVRVEAVPIAQAEERLGNFTGPASGTAQDDNVKASLDLLHSKVGGGTENIGTGNVFYVDSNVASEGAGTSWIGAKDTLDEAVDLCTNNNGDVIYVAAGHNENWNSVDSADLDVIGITVIGLGTGTDRPRFDYDTADSELVIAAANVTIYNLTFQPGINQTVHAIEVEADADGSIIDSCEFFEGEAASTDEFIDAIQLALAADDITVSNCIVTETAAGANTWLDASTGIVDNLVVYGNRVRGDFAEGGIYSNKACTACYIAGNTVTNLSTGIAAITFSAAATGTMVNNYASSDTPGTIIDPGSMEQAGNVETDEGAAEDADQAPAWASSAAGTGAYPINIENDSLFAKILAMDNTGVATVSDFNNATMSLEALNVDLDAIIADFTDYHLDHLAYVIDGGSNAYPDSVAAQSILAFLMCDGADPAITTFNNTTDSLEAIADHVQTLLSVADGTGAFPVSVVADSCLAKILAMDNAGIATATDFNNETMSLEALNVDLDAIIAGTSNAGQALPSTKSLFDVIGEVYTDDAGTDDLDDVYSHLKLIFDIVAGTATTGEVYYVDSNGGGADSSGYGVSWAKPCITIDYAEGLATADSGDIILVASLHSEDIGAAATDLTMAKAGVKVIGLGHGRNRPKLTFKTDVGADIEIDNSCAFYNIVFDVASLDNITAAIDVDAADVEFHDCEFLVADAAAQAATVINLDAGADRFLVKNCRFVGGANDGPTSIITMVATAPEEVRIIDSWFEADCGDACIFGSGTPTDLLIQGCHIANLDAGEHAIELQGNATGVIKNCTVATDTYATAIDPGTCRTYNTLWYDSDVPGDATGIPVLAISLGGATQISVADLTLIEAEATDAIEADLLHLFIALADGTDPAPASVAADSILAKIMGDDAAAVATTFDNQTDSLEALGIKTEQIAGGDGVASWSAAAEAANGVSIAEVLRYVQEKQLPRMELKAYADLTGYDDAVAFTVTGDVMVRVVGVVGATGITTTSGTTTLTVGTTEDVDALLPSTVMDNADFAATDVWIDNNPEDDAQVMGATEWTIVGGGADITLFRNVDDITAGTLTLYCWWVPLSANGDVTAP